MAEDRALHPDQVLDVVGVPPAVRSTLEQAQHRGDDHAADRRGRVVARLHSPTRVVSGSRTTGAYAARSAARAGRRGRWTSAATASREVALVEGARAVGGDQLERRREVGHQTTVVGEPTRRVVQRARGSPGPTRRSTVVHVVEVVARRRAQPRSRRAPRRWPVPTSSRHGRWPSRACASPKAAREPWVATEPGADRDRDPAAVLGRDVPRLAAWERRRRDRRPGLSIHPSTVYADPVAGCTVTKPPELSETSPTSVTIATRAAAIAASTAEPPARAIASAASAASWLGAATARVSRGPVAGAQRRVAMTADASAATITSTAVNRSSVSHCSRSVSTRP